MWCLTSQPLPDKAGDVHIDKGGHQVLAVKSIHDAPVPGDGVGKVLPIKRKCFIEPSGIPIFNLREN